MAVTPRRLIAMMQPDLRDYKHFRDIFNYFFQHVLIILIPFYILFTRQYDLYHWSWENLVVRNPQQQQQRATSRRRFCGRSLHSAYRRLSFVLALSLSPLRVVVMPA
jgi:hypothetical protein